MNSRIITGIDLGTHSVRVLITEHNGTLRPKILGAGVAESRGLSKGYIINIRETAQSVRAALNAAEDQAGLRINEVYVGVGGIGLEGIQLKGEATASRSDGIFTENELDRCDQYAKNKLPESENKVVLMSYPIAYYIDGKYAPVTSPVGMKGLKLEVLYHYITILKQHHDAIRDVMHEAGVDVEEFFPSPVATGFVALSRKQLASGSILADIGSETLSVCAFENQVPISLEVFDIGSGSLTGDLARSLHVSMEEAEDIKLGALHKFPIQKIGEVYQKNLSDIFALVSSHIKKIERDNRLPGGIVITGGGSRIEDIAGFASDIVDLYATTETPLTTGQKSIFSDTSFLTAYGLCVLAVLDEYDGDGRHSANNGQVMDKVKKHVKNILHQLLP